MLKKIKKILSIKFDFRYLKKREILVICYSIHSQQFKFLHEKLSDKIEFIPYEKKNFIIFIYFVFIFFFNLNIKKNLDIIYYCNLIKFSKAKVFISDIDNNYNFFLIKSFLKRKISVVLIQNGGRSYHTDIFSFLDSKQEEHKVDHLIIWGKNLEKEYKKYLKTNIHILGSLKTNHYLGRNLNEKKIHEEEDESIMFISQFRTQKKIKDVEKDILKSLDEYTFNKNIKLKINLAYQDEINSKKEISYYNNLFLKSDLKLCANKTLQESYLNTIKSKLIVCCDSSMGYELFGVGKKVVFLTVRDDCKLGSYKFGWPGKYSNSGQFWDNSLNKHNFNDTLDKIYNMSSSNWNNITQNFRNEIIVLDKDIKEKLSEIIEKSLH